MKKAAIYARVSTEQQADKELSIPAQIREINEFAVKKGFQVVKIYKEEGASAKTADRPQFQKMITDAKKEPPPFDVLLIHKNNRFARNARDAAVYKHLLRKDRGIELISIKDNFNSLEGPESVLMERIMDSFDEYYSLNLAQEVKKGMREKALQGKALGKPPLGYRIGDDGFLKIQSEEAVIVKYIFNKYIATNRGLRYIAELLKNKGLQKFGETAFKYKWSAQGIRNIIVNPAYIGKMCWNKKEAASNQDLEKEIIVEDAHPAIISKQLFSRAGEKLKEKQNKRGDSQDYLLRGLVKCLDCGGSMTQYSESWKRKNGTVIKKKKLRCSNYVHSTKKCYFNHIDMGKIEKIVEKYLKEKLACEIGPGQLKLAEQKQPDFFSLQQKIEELNKIEQRFDRQMRAYEEGIIELAELKKYQMRLQKEKLDLKKEIKKQDKEKQNYKLEKKELKNKLTDILVLLFDNRYSVETRRYLLKTALDRIEYSRKQNKMLIFLKKS